MATLRYTDGPVTVTLDGGLEALVRKALDAAGGEALRIVEELAEGVADEAGDKWYQPGTGVTRRTGKSGRIAVVETVSESEVRVRVGSVDVDKAKFVHRPGRLSTSVEEITQTAYKAERAKGGAAAKLVFHARKDDEAAGVKKGLYYRKVHNPLASDGKYLLPELVSKPARQAVKDALPKLGKAISDKAGR